MATQASLGLQAHKAQEKALEVIAEHASAERQESIALIPLERAHTGSPAVLAALQGELIAGLAEIVRDQERRISELENAASTNTKAAKK